MSFGSPLQSITERVRDSSNYYYSKVINAKNAQDVLAGYSFFTTQNERYRKESDTLGIVYTLRLISFCELNLGMYYDAENTSVMALKILDDLDDKSDFYIDYKKAFYNNLGIIYRSLYNYDASILNYKKALSLAETALDSATIINNLGIIFRYKEEFKKSQIQFQNAYSLFVSSQDTINTLIALDNLGSVQGKLDQGEGLKKMVKALSIRLKNDDFPHIYTSYKHLSEFYKDQSDLVKANYYADLGYEAAKTYSAEYTNDALSNKLALLDNEIIREYLKLNDSITRAKLVNENKFASAKYNLGKEKEQTQIVRIQREKQKRGKLTYLAIALVVLITSVALIAIILLQRKKKRLQAILNTETRISKRLHDELANDMFQLMAQLQNIKGVPEEFINGLDEIYIKTRDISKDYSPLHKTTRFYDQLTGMLASYKSERFNVMVRNDQNIKWDSLSPLKKNTVFIVLKELMTNNRKHSQSNFALIIFGKNRKKLDISYTDDGIGATLNKNNGLQNVESRIHSLNGTITFDSEINKGFKVNIRI